MRNAFLYILVGALVVILLTGCVNIFGYQSYPKLNCESEDIDTLWRIIDPDRIIRGDNKELPPTKEDVTKARGEPDEVKTYENDEEWIYENSLWCGSLISIYPLMLPICDGYDRIYFINGTAKHIYFNETKTTGYWFLEGNIDSGSCP